jgi:predicted transcriptional regulator
VEFLKSSGYTFGMKTAISIADDVFRKAEHYARQKRKSRSEVYSEAISEYLARRDTDAVTDAVNETLKQVGQSIDPFVQESTRRTLKRIEW